MLRCKCGSYIDKYREEYGLEICRKCAENVRKYRVGTGGSHETGAVLIQENSSPIDENAPPVKVSVSPPKKRQHVTRGRFKVWDGADKVGSRTCLFFENLAPAIKAAEKLKDPHLKDTQKGGVGQILPCPILGRTWKKSPHANKIRGNTIYARNRSCDLS